jgi:hypothetical protein
MQDASIGMCVLYYSRNRDYLYAVRMGQQHIV